MLYYFPLESYQERYTAWLSCPNGFFETFLLKNMIPFCAIRPKVDFDQPGRIRAGKGFVLDAYKRSVWAMRQVEEFLKLLDAGQVSDKDVVYIEDFWHPGLEALAYARSIYNVNFKMYAWCWAQTVDTSDFTYRTGMTPWMRYFEMGIAKCLDGMFVADPVLKEMLLEGGVDQCPVYAVGLPYDPDWVANYYWKQNKHDPELGDLPRSNTVVYSSRWDSEKNPDFYCALAHRMLNSRDDVVFLVATGFQQVTSDKPHLLRLLEDVVKKYPHKFIVQANLSKFEYLDILRQAKVQFNCAEQDFVSFTLLDSATMGCMPLMPDYKTFPAAVLYQPQYLYRKGDLDDAVRKLEQLLAVKEQPDVSNILVRHGNTIPYICKVMGVWNA